MAIHNAMKKAMVAKAEDDSYLPPPFISLPEVDCQESGQPIDIIIDAHESQPQPRSSRADLVGEQDVLSMRGKKILDWAIFHVVEDYLAGMSKAFQKSLELCIASDEVLRAIFTKIDSRSLENVNKLHGNFTMFLGSAWRTLKMLKHNTAMLIEWVIALLQPLVPVAASAYITESRVFERQANPTRPSSEVSPATTTKSASEYTLLKNIRKLQGPAYKTFSESPPASLPIVTNADSDSAVVDEEDHPSSRSPSPVWSGIQDELPPLPGSVLSLEELEQLISELSLIEEAHGAHPYVLAPTLEELMADLFRLLEWDSTPESTPSVTHCKGCICWAGASYPRSLPETPISSRVLALIDWSGGLGRGMPAGRSLSFSPGNAGVELDAQPEMSVAGGGAVTDASAVEAASDTQISTAGGGAITDANTVQAASPAAAEDTAASTSLLLPPAEISLPASAATHTAADGRAVATLSAPKKSSSPGSSGASGLPSSRRRSPLTPRNAADGTSPRYPPTPAGVFTFSPLLIIKWPAHLANQ